MRIISQDRMIDVPYGQISIERRENEIWCGYSSTMSEHCIGKLFAKYSIESKAIKVMELLHEMYKWEKMEETYGNGVYDYCPIFQFPREDEVDIEEEKG